MFTLVALLPSLLTLASVATYAVKRAFSIDWTYEATRLAMKEVSE